MAKPKPPKRLIDEVAQLQLRDGSVPASEIRSIVEEVKSLILIDAPLPRSELSRYLATICMAGVHNSRGADQREWVKTMTQVIKMEHGISKDEPADRDGTRVEFVENLLKAAEKYDEEAAESTDDD